jgi:SAM-dependent methyltransferase
MHPSAYKNAKKFYHNYCEENIENKKILDIGSYDVNGTVKPIFEKGNYIGIDMEEGPNVDIVSDAHNIPFEDNYFDIILSTSCFEHDDMFWVTFLEICRITKPGGFIYINAPSAGDYHGYPGDNWRFYIDSWKALEKWAHRNNQNIKLLESYIDNDKGDSDHDVWKDSIGIYVKI